MKERFVKVKNLEDIKSKYNPQYVLITSDRNDGKSYAVKEKCLRDFWEKGMEFSYLRRYEIDLKREDQALYWADFVAQHDDKGRNIIQQITHDKWSAIVCPRGSRTFNLANPLEKPGQYEVGPVCGRLHALAVARSYKSLQFPNISNILYEEFITDSGYLFNEPARLFNYVSTVLRSDIGTVWMIGNTISRLNPYYREWQLTNALKMKPGQVDTYEETYTNDAGETSKTTVCMYWPDVEGKVSKTSMFFGNAAGMIQGTKWDSREQPHLEKPRKEYAARYQLVFESGAGLNFLLSLLQHREDSQRVLWYVEPKTTAAQKRTRLIGGVPHEGQYWTRDFQPLNERERRAFDLIRLGRIAYSDNLTGTEFQRALAQLQSDRRGTGTEG